jgi:hypothetical protein
MVAARSPSLLLFLVLVVAMRGYSFRSSNFCLAFHPLRHPLHHSTRTATRTSSATRQYSKGAHRHHPAPAIRLQRHRQPPRFCLYSHSHSTPTTTTTTTKSNKNLWSVQDCIEQRDSITFIDATWYHKGSRNGRQEYVHNTVQCSIHTFLLAVDEE